jgi:hypothetical protein
MPHNVISAILSETRVPSVIDEGVDFFPTSVLYHGNIKIFYAVTIYCIESFSCSKAYAYIAYNHKSN